MTDPAVVDDASGLPEEVLDPELLPAPAPDDALLPARLDLDHFLATSGLDAARLAELRAAAAVVEELYDASVTESSRRAYEDDWAHFTAWCARYSLVALPAEPATVALYLGAYADTFSVSTLEGRLSGIAHHHIENGHRSPARHDAVRRIKKGLKRTRGKPPQQKEPLYGPLLDVLVTQGATVRDAAGRLTLVSARDRAVILLGQALGDRRSEVVAVRADQLAFTTEGLRVGEGRSKTNQEAKAQGKVVPYNYVRPDLCPVRAVEDWMDLAAVPLDAAVPLFVAIDRWGNLGTKPLTGQSVNLIIKNAGRAAGLPARLVAELAGGSLRAGLVAGATAGGAQDSAIMDQTHHTKVTTMNGYQRGRARGAAPAAAYTTLPSQTTAARTVESEH